MYTKILGVLALVAVAGTFAWKVTTWHQQAQLVPVLRAELRDVTAGRDLLRGQITSMNSVIAQTNQEIEKWKQKGDELSVSVLAAQSKAVAESVLRLAAERKLRETPPPKDCGGAMRWLVTHAPRGWEVTP